MKLSLVNNNSTAPTPDINIRVLLLDTPENEGVDFIQSIRKQGLHVDSERVCSGSDLFDMLRKHDSDLLLVNDHIESPSQGEILEFLQGIDSDTGLVLLTSEMITVDVLTNAYHLGIADVVSGLNPDYSCEVFGRAAEKSRRNFQLSQLNQDKFELTRHRDQLMSGTEEALAYLQDGLHMYANDAYLSLLG